jgi:hypothetical protein
MTVTVVVVAATSRVTYLRDRAVSGGVLTVRPKTVRDAALVIVDASGKQIAQVSDYRHSATGPPSSSWPNRMGTTSGCSV